MGGRPKVKSSRAVKCRRPEARSCGFPAVSFPVHPSAENGALCIRSPGAMNKISLPSLEYSNASGSGNAENQTWPPGH